MKYDIHLIDRILDKLGYIPKLGGIQEQGRGKESVLIAEFKTLKERINHGSVWKITRHNSEEDKERKRIYVPGLALEMFGGQPQFDVFHGNLLVNEGINEMWTVLCSASGNEWNNADAVLIVGTGSGAAAAGDTEATFTAGVKVAMEAGFPTYGTSQKASWKSSYGSSAANQAWNEFGCLNNTTSGDLMNRKISAEGTKTAGQTWDLTLEITLS